MLTYLQMPETKIFHDQIGQFSLVNSGINHAIANQIVVILSFAAASISLWPANLLQSLLRTGFTSVPGVQFYCSSPIFSVSRTRASANCTSNFASSWLLAMRRHVLKSNRSTRISHITSLRNLYYYFKTRKHRTK